MVDIKIYEHGDDKLPPDLKVVLGVSADAEQWGNLVTELQEIGSNRVFFVMYESEPVASVQLVLRHADSDPQLANGRDIAHIHALFVRSDRRRRGHAWVLMEALEAEARKRGFRTLTLGVDDWSLPARSLYERLGYGLLKTAPGRTDEERVLYLHKRMA